MNIAICEDNLSEANALSVKVENYMPKSILITAIDIYENAESLLQSDELYDLVIFDCKLPDMDGVEAARLYREKNRFAVIIFVTAYIEYAAGGYEVDALRYLLKPVSNEKLSEALVAFESSLRGDCTVEIRGLHEPFFVKSSEIMYIEALGRRTVVRLEGMSVESHKSLSVFEQEIRSDAFFKTRRQFIVNMKYIRRKDGNELYMENGEKVIISRRTLASFNKAYANYLKFYGG